MPFCFAAPHSYSPSVLQFPPRFPPLAQPRARLSFSLVPVGSSTAPPSGLPFESIPIVSLPCAVGQSFTSCMTIHDVLPPAPVILGSGVSSLDLSRECYPISQGVLAPASSPLPDFIVGPGFLPVSGIASLGDRFRYLCGVCAALQGPFRSRRPLVFSVGQSRHRPQLFVAIGMLVGVPAPTSSVGSAICVIYQASLLRTAGRWPMLLRITDPLCVHHRFLRNSLGNVRGRNGQNPQPVLAGVGVKGLIGGAGGDIV